MPAFIRAKESGFFDDTMPDAPSARIVISVRPDRLPLCRLLLTYGFRFQARAGVSVSEFLVNALPIDPGYLAEQVQTIFKDGNPVDFPDQTEIRQSCTLSLSAAMPGVFGAAFRKDGHFGPLRRQGMPSCCQAPAGQQQDTLCVTVKCFNAVAAAIGDHLLHQGVCMGKADFHRFWRLHGDNLKMETHWMPIDEADLPEEQTGNGLTDDSDQIWVTVEAVD